jgi:hypothetical protein
LKDWKVKILFASSIGQFLSLLLGFSSSGVESFIGAIILDRVVYLALRWSLF